jgi:hypothetical protein
LAGFLFVFNENDFGMVALRANERALVKARLTWLDLDNAGLGAALTAIWIIDDCGEYVGAMRASCHRRERNPLSATDA